MAAIAFGSCDCTRLSKRRLLSWRARQLSSAGISVPAGSPRNPGAGAIWLGSTERVRILPFALTSSTVVPARVGYDLFSRKCEHPERVRIDRSAGGIVGHFERCVPSVTKNAGAVWPKYAKSSVAIAYCPVRVRWCSGGAAERKTPRSRAGVRTGCPSDRAAWPNPTSRDFRD